MPVSLQIVTRRLSILLSPCPHHRRSTTCSSVFTRCYTAPSSMHISSIPQSTNTTTEGSRRCVDHALACETKCLVVSFLDSRRLHFHLERAVFIVNIDSTMQYHGMHSLHRRNVSMPGTHGSLDPQICGQPCVSLHSIHGPPSPLRDKTTPTPCNHAQHFA